MLRVSQVGLHVFYRFNPNARAFEAEPQHAVFVNLPAQAMAPTAPLRIATAMVEQTIDATLTPPPPPQAPVQQTAQPGKLAIPDATPAANVGKASDVASQARATTEPAAS
jgi:hypothetical protein